MCDLVKKQERTRCRTAKKAGPSANSEPMDRLFSGDFSCRGLVLSILRLVIYLVIGRAPCWLGPGVWVKGHKMFGAGEENVTPCSSSWTT